MAEANPSTSNVSDEHPSKSCDPCLFRDINKQAGTYCQDCSEDLKDATKVKNDMLKQSKPVTLEFHQSENMKTLMSETTSMGEQEYQEEHMHTRDTGQSDDHRFCFLDMSTVTNKKSIDAGNIHVSGCTFMPDAELVISCSGDRDSVKVFTRDFKLRNEMAFGSGVWDVAALSNNEVIVTQPVSKCLQILNISGNIEKGKSIGVGRECWGIDCANDRLYVSCHSCYGDGGEIKVLTLDGVTVNTFHIGQGDPYYLAVNDTGNRILVSTADKMVLCFDNSGNQLYAYSDRQFDTGGGLLVDSDGNFMVCADMTENIHVVKGDGTKHGILLACTDGLCVPMCAAYRPSDNTLVVGQDGPQHPLLSFTVKV